MLLSRCDTAGIEVLYKIGGKLVGECTRRPSSFVISECLFADDAALICSSRADIYVAARIFEEVMAEFGLALSILKTKLLVAGVHLTTGDLASLELGGGSVEVVKEFKYLGSLIESHGGMTGEVTRRIAQASRVFGEHRSSAFTACDFSLETKRYSLSISSTWCAFVWCRDLGSYSGACKEVRDLSSSLC